MSVYERRYQIHNPKTRYVWYTDNFREMLAALARGLQVAEGGADYSFDGGSYYRFNTRALTVLPTNHRGI